MYILFERNLCIKKVKCPAVKPGGEQDRDVTGKVHIKVAGRGLFCVAMLTATNKGHMATNRASEMYIYIIELSWF